jgi:hypothetical protein
MWYRLAAVLPVSLITVTPVPAFYYKGFLVTSPEVADKGPRAT